MKEEENNNQNLPPVSPQDVPEFLQGDQWFGVDVAPYRLDFTKRYERPRYILSMDHVPFAPLGGIQCSTGQAGNGKTMTMAQFMAAVLSGEFGNLRYELSDIIPNPTVLYIDTEMEEANTIAVKNRVLTMCNRPIDVNYDDFIVIMLREVQEQTVNGVRVSSSAMRWRMTLKAIYQYKPTIVFIDGLLDVIADFNNNVECQDLIYKCMQVASHYGISVWCVVHQNPGGEKLVGHLGSFLERKVTDIFLTKKDKDVTTGEATFTVSQKKSRGQDVKDWKFRVMPVAGWGMPEQFEAPVVKKDPVTADSIDDIKKWIQEAGTRFNWPMTRTDIKKKVFGEIGGQKNSTKQQLDLDVAINLKMFEESTMKSGNGSYMLQPSDGDNLPF